MGIRSSWGYSASSSSSPLSNCFTPPVWRSPSEAFNFACHSSVHTQTWSGSKLPHDDVFEKEGGTLDGIVRKFAHEVV